MVDEVAKTKPTGTEQVAHSGDSSTGDTTAGASKLHPVPGPGSRAEQSAIVDPAKNAVSTGLEVKKGTLPQIAVDNSDGHVSDSNPKIVQNQGDTLTLIPPLAIKTSDAAVTSAPAAQPAEKTAPPALDKVPAVAPSDAPLTKEQLDEQRKVGSFYQSQRLLPFLDAITPVTPPKEGQSAQDAAKDRAALIEQRKTAIEKEMSLGDAKNWSWGPASQAAFKDYLDTMQSKTFPALVRGLESLGQTAAADSPGTLPVESGVRMTPEQYQNQILAGQRNLDLQIDATKPPMKADAIKIENAVEWMGRTSDQLKDAELQRSDAALTQLIKDRKMPEGWLYKDGEDKTAWREAAKSMIELTLKLGREVSISDKLALHLTYPPGTTTSKDSDGRLIANLNLPQDLRLDDPVNATKIRQLVDFDKQAEPQIERAVKQLEANQKNPVGSVGWGDMNVPQFKDASGTEHPTQGVFEKAGKDDKGNDLPGKLVAFAQVYQKADGSWANADGSKYQAKDGQTLQPLNLLEQRPKLDVQNNGDITVNFKTQAQDVPWYGYQNMVFVKNVGDSADLKPVTYKPDDIVAVNNGGQSEFMLAKDLKANFDMQSTLYVGQKVLSTTMDAAMLATGTVELAAAVKGAGLLIEGGEMAMKLSASNVAWYAGKGLFDAGLGLLDPDNAHFNATEAGRKAIAVHSGLFVLAATPAALEAVKSVGQVARGALGLGALEDATKLAQAQAQAMEFQKLVQDSGAGFAVTADWAGKVMGYAQIPMAPMVGSGFLGNIKEMFNGTDPYATYKAVLEFETTPHSPDSSAPPVIPIAEVKPDPPDQASRIVDGYKDMLTAPLTADKADAAAKIKALFDELKTAVSHDAKPEQVAALKQELAGNITFSPDDVKFIEQFYHPKLSPQQIVDLQDPEKLKSFPDETVRNRAEYVLASKKPGEPKTFTPDDVAFIEPYYRAPLTSEQLHDLMDPEKRKNFPDGTVRARADIILSEKNPDLVAASEIALTYLARQTGTKPPAPMASVDIAPGVSIGLDQKLITDDMKRQLDVTSHDSRGIVTGDLLAKVGAISPQQFGSVLVDVLKSPDATPEAKMRALSDASGARIGAIIAGMYMQESKLASDKTITPQQKNEILAANFGITSKDLEGAILTSANSDPDANVRAMSAGLLYGLQKMKIDPESGVKFLDQLTSMKQSEYDKSQSSFAKDVTAAMTQDLASSKPQDIAERVAAYESISALASKLPQDQGSALREQASKALVESFQTANLPQANKLFETLTPENLKQLNKDDPAAANAVRIKAMQLMQAPPANYSPTYEKQLSMLIKQVPSMADGTSDVMKQIMYGALKNVLDKSGENYYDLRSATIDSISSLGDKGSSAIPALRQLAASDQYGEVRQAAVTALERLHDPNLAQQVPELLKSESDAAVSKTLRDVQFRLASGQEAAKLYSDTTKDILTFQSEIKDRYPDLQKFDDKAQKDWVLATFPLLDKDNFVKELQSATKDKLNNWFFGTSDQAGNALASQRDDQFKALAALAKGDANSPATQQARQLLYSIIASQGSTVDSNQHSIYIGERINMYPRAPAEFTADNMTLATYYNEKPIDWTNQAALALADTTTSSGSGRDLSARLISMALAAGVQGEAKAALLDAWKRLNPDGHRTVSESLYQYVLKLGS